MIYLTFDSNIWIYLLDDSWKEDNALDYLEHWIETKEIQIILPKIIFSEWDNNKKKEKAERKKKLREFFSMAEEILPTYISVLKDRKRPDELEKIVERQFNRIENLLKSNVIELEISQEVKNQAIERCLSKLAPMHKNKNSVADTMIFLSLLEFIVNNPTDEYIFLSENVKDFFELETKTYKASEIIEQWEVIKEESDLNIYKNSIDGFIKSLHAQQLKLHSDLKEKITSFNFKEFQDLRKLLDYLKSRIPITIDLEFLRKERINNQIKELTSNPEDVKYLNDLPKDSYIDNLRHLEIILKKYTPSQAEARFTLALINSESVYEEYFYKNLKSKIWFRILKEKGVFNHNNNPSPIEIEKGFQVPLWLPLLYLEKLSAQIKEGKEVDLTDEIIEIIKNVSENPKDNYRTWYSFINILNNLPNEEIPKEIFDFIPTWLESRFDSSHLSAEICKELLPKFLPNSPTSEDIEKAEIILSQLFVIERAEKMSPKNEQNFIFRIGNYATDILVDENIIPRIAKYCSNELIYQIANNLKKLILNFLFGINLTINSNNQEFTLKATIQDNSLNLQLTSKENSSTIIAELEIENFEQYNDNQTRRKILYFLKKENINIKFSKENSSNLRYFINKLIHGTNYRFRIYSISEITNRTYHREIEANFALIFRDLLDQKVKQNPIEAIRLLKSFAFDNNYRAAFFKKSVLYVIKENWQKTKSVFWDLVKDTDKEGLFSNSSYNDDLYELLNRNQQYLTNTEIKKLEKIINQGPKNNA